MFWSYLLAGVGIVGLFFIGKAKRVGWTICIAAQILWIAYALVTKQYGFIISAVAYAAVYILGWKNFHQRKLEKEKHAE